MLVTVEQQIVHFSEYYVPLLTVTFCIHGDMSADPKAYVDEAENLPCSLLKVEQVIKRIFQEYGVKLPITEKIRASFKSKLWRMGQRISKLGSVKCKELLEDWKYGRDSVWQVQVDTNCKQGACES